MSETVSIRMDVAEVQRRMDALASPGTRTGIALAIKGWLQEVIQRAFETESTPEGEKWPPLSEKYARWKATAHGGRPLHAIRASTGKAEVLLSRKMLYLRGDLFRGFAGAQAPGIVVETGQGNIRVTAFSALPYAGVHQYGGRAGRGLRAFIPKRSYLPTPAFAEQKIPPIVEEILQEAAGAS